MRTYSVKNSEKGIDCFLVTNANGNDSIFTVMEVIGNDESKAFIPWNVGTVLSEVEMGVFLRKVSGTTIKTEGVSGGDWTVEAANITLDNINASIIAFPSGIGIFQVTYKPNASLEMTMKILKGGKAVTFSDDTISRLGHAVEVPGEGEEPATADKTQLVIEHPKTSVEFDLRNELGIKDFGGEYQVVITYNNLVYTKNYVY